MAPTFVSSEDGGMIAQDTFTPDTIAAKLKSEGPDSWILFDERRETFLNSPPPPIREQVPDLLARHW